MNPVTKLAIRSAAVAAVVLLAGCGAAPGDAADRAAEAEKTKTPPTAVAKENPGGIVKINKTDEEWRKQLTPSQYRVLREKGTEMAFTGALLGEKRQGVFLCAACGLELFGSDSKFESGTGWPSFTQPIARENVDEIMDDSHGMRRVEVVCARCGGHLGHVFDDGPRPTGLRYCLNSVSLRFEPAQVAGSTRR